MSLTCVEASPSSFRAALGSVAASVNVITMWDEGHRPCGMTATAFASVSADPLLVLVCINRATRTYDHVAAAGRFGVNVLGSAAHEISDYCSRPGSDKLLDEDWLADTGTWHCPALSGALAFLDCQIDQEVQAATESVLSSWVVRTKTTGTPAARAASTSDTSFGAIATAALTSWPALAIEPSGWQKSFWTSTSTSAHLAGS